MEIELKFERNLLNLGLVSVEEFIKYASRIQNCINIIAKETEPSLNKELYRLLIKDRKEGSQIYDLIPASQTSTLDKSPIKSIFETFKEINGILEQDQNGNKYNDIKGNVKNHKRRNRLFNDLQILSRHPGSFSVSLIAEDLKERLPLFTPQKKYKSSINSWKKLEITKRKEEFTGALTIIHGEGDIYFKIRDIYGISIKHRLLESEVNEYVKYFKQIVKVSGFYNPIKSILETIEEFTLYNNIKLTELHDIKFKDAIQFELSFWEDAFLICNKDLGLYGAGKTFKEMYENLYEDMTSAINAYINTKQELTPGAEKIRSLLLKLIDIDTLRG